MPPEQESGTTPTSAEPTATSDDQSAVSVEHLILEILRLPDLSAGEKRSLIDEVRKSAPPWHDRWIYRWGIWILGGIAVMTVAALAVLSSLGDSIPEGLVALGSAAVGGLAGVLASPPHGRQGPS